MKRHGNIYERVWSIENLRLALYNAQKGKKKQRSVKRFLEKEEENLLILQNELRDKAYKTSPYTTFILKQEKVRKIHRLPFRDRVCHHAIAQIVIPILYPTFTADTYSCIPLRGIHKCSYNLRKALQNPNNKYVLKFDVRKYYESINHSILKTLLRRKIKDNAVLWLLDEVIDSIRGGGESAIGIPIGNYCSQIFANLYLSGFDHWIKEAKKVGEYMRYMDDIVVLAETKQELHQLFKEIELYLNSKLQLSIKPNWRVFPVELGIDMVGYVHYKDYTGLRKRIKQRFARMMRRRYRKESFASYAGWTSHCDAKNLIKKLLNQQI